MSTHPTKTLSWKAQRYPELLCPECIKDPDIECERDPDVECLRCREEGRIVKLCAYHMKIHLEREHFVSCKWRGS